MKGRNIFMKKVELEKELHWRKKKLLQMQRHILKLEKELRKNIYKL